MANIIMCTLLRKQSIWFEVCPECEGHITQSIERGERVCRYCGLIVNEREIDIAHPDKRAFTYKDRKEKINYCPPISAFSPDIGLSTLIDRTQICNSDFLRAAKIDSQLNWKDRNMLIALTELKRISYNLNIVSHIKELAFDLYKKAFDANILKGRSIKAMVIACLYHACKIENFPRTLQELLDQSSSNQKSIIKCYRVLLKALSLENHNSKPLDPLILIPRYVADLGLDTEFEGMVIKVLRKYKKNKFINGVNPKGLCAGSIYLVAKLKNIKLSQKNISQVIGITEVTLRARYKEIIKVMDFF
ncbi:MAG: transcription initiation factor IIB [Promethearchaeota archaeon]